MDSKKAIPAKEICSLLTGLMLLLLTGCNDSGFKGRDVSRPEKPVELKPLPEPEPPAPVEEKVSARIETIEVGCNQFGSTSSLRLKQKPSEKDGMVVEAEICTKKSEAAVERQVMFVVDLSGSMQSSDPIVEGRCERFHALRFSISQLAQSPNSDRFIQVGVIGFETAIQVLHQMQSPKKVLETMQASEVCAYGGDTNYQDALDTAFQMLTPYQGKKDLYLISDGFPTVRSFSDRAIQRIEAPEYQVTLQELSQFGFDPEIKGRDSIRYGLAAARFLRKNLQDLNFYAFFFGSSATDPRPYLEAITGNSANVQVVTEASGLVRKIQDYAEVYEDEPKLVEAFLEVQGPYDTLQVETGKLSRSEEGIWVYRSRPFKHFSTTASEGEFLADPFSFTLVFEDDQNNSYQTRLQVEIPR